jgi:DNA polymerase III alpha subunit
MSQAQYITTRSFLWGNRETILENLNARRRDSQNESDSLFGGGDESGNDHQIAWSYKYELFTKLQILKWEKESLGLYVSGNPLEDYAGLWRWVQEVTRREDIWLISVEKIKKIFTRNNNLMLALQLTTLEGSREGVIFPPRAADISGSIEEDRLYWVLAEKSEQDNQKVNESGEVVDYGDLPKLVVQQVTGFEEGPLPLLREAGEQIALNMEEKLHKVDWSKLLENPQQFAYKRESQGSQSVLSNSSQEINWVKIPKTMSTSELAQIKKKLRREYPGSGAVKVKLQVQTNNHYRTVKGEFWLLPEEWRQVQEMVRG